MKKKLISIIIPVYNTEQYLRECLDSVVNQTYKNLEIIIIDDWSTDNSGKICDEYANNDKRIKVLHQKNADLSAARNAGLKIATWEYIWYIDSDDYVELDMYEKLYSLIETSKSDLVICNWYINQKDGLWIKNTKFPNKKIVDPDEALEYFYNSMYVWNKLYSKEFVKDLLFVETFAQDVIYNFAIFKKIKRIACLDECLNYYRYNPTSRLHTKKFRKNRFIFLNEWINQEILYAKERSLHKLENLLIDARCGIIIKWLSIIFLENKIDQVDAENLLKLIRQNIFLFLKSKRNIIKKLFVLVACVNVKFASKIYKLMLKSRLYKEDL